MSASSRLSGSIAALLLIVLVGVARSGGRLRHIPTKDIEDYEDRWEIIDEHDD